MSPAFNASPDQLTLALSKGRIFSETLPLLAAAGIHVTEDPETSRKLILPTSDPAVRVIIVRASDVPTYVQYGAADFGVAGKDVLMETGMTGLYAPRPCARARGWPWLPSTCRPRASTSPRRACTST